MASGSSVGFNATGRVQYACSSGRAGEASLSIWEFWPNTVVQRDASCGGTSLQATPHSQRSGACFEVQVSACKLKEVGQTYSVVLLLNLAVFLEDLEAPFGKKKHVLYGSSNFRRKREHMPALEKDAGRSNNGLRAWQSVSQTRAGLRSHLCIGAKTPACFLRRDFLSLSAASNAGCHEHGCTGMIHPCGRHSRKRCKVPLQ